MPGDIKAYVAVEKIDLLTKIIEAYDNLGIVSTVDRGKGLVIIRCTDDTCPEITEIITHLPFPVEIIR